MNFSDNHCSRLASSQARLRCGGMALVITLALIALLTITILAFFIRVTGNTRVETDRAGRSETEVLARSGCDYVVNLFVQEIVNPSYSTAYPIASTTGAVTIYQPVANTNAVAAREIAPTISVTNPNFASLIRQSIPTADANASGDNTSTPAQNGRLISTNSWNAPILLGNGGFSQTGQLPNWIYLTSANGVANSATASGIIGRFSYNVYDTSGLLDANVVGSPGAIISSLGPTLKGTLAGTDLVQLGLGLSQTDNDALMSFRNSSAAQGSISPPNWTNWIAASAPSGFLSDVVTNVDTATVYTNNCFVGRQDLIRYTNQCPTIAGLLPYLTTFSREATGPSWSPSADLGSFTYRSNAETASSTNRFLPTVPVRMVFPRSDGTQAVLGEPLLKERFPLSRLNLLVSTPPSAADAAKILLYFGLTWTPATTTGSLTSPAKWVYDHGATDGNGHTAIYTLDQVASLPVGREPDFFELLKAGVLSGSLGQDPGDESSSAPGSGKALAGFQGSAGGFFTERYSIGDRHVIQLGVNIIDQWKPNNYPTAIYFQSYTLTDPFKMDLYNTVFGVKNLPYLTQIDSVVCQVNASQTSGWLRPEIWNPHLTPPNSSVPGPTQFRIRAYNTCVTSMTEWATVLAAHPDGDTQTTVSSKVTYSGNALDTGTSSSTFIYFSAGSSDFRDAPQYLTSTTSGLTTSPNNVATLNVEGGTFNFVGFFAGTIADFNWMTRTGLLANSTYSIWTTILFKPDNKATSALTPMDFILDYLAPDGTWRPYNYISNLDRSYNDRRNPTDPGSDRTGYTVDAAGNLQLPQTSLSTTIAGDPHGDISVARVDPRSDRFSVSMGNIGTAGTSAQFLPGVSFQWGNSTSQANPIFDAWPGTGKTTFAYLSYPLVAGQPSQLLLWGFVVNTSSSNSRYTDEDGIIRPADAWKQNPATGDGCILYPGKSADPCRPVVLNHPFDSVADLGYAFRDLPFKSLDFATTSSADTGLLDLFCLNEVTPMVSGHVNLSRASSPVLKAILVGGEKDSTQALSSSEASTLAAALGTSINTQGPLLNRADLVARLSNIIDTSSALTTQDKDDKPYREAAVRALASVVNTRTWNLLIDVIAQAGQVRASNATGSGFIVQGQKRYWLHVAIDRYTGEVVDEVLEPVYE